MNPYKEAGMVGLYETSESPIYYVCIGLHTIYPMTALIPFDSLECFVHIF